MGKILAPLLNILILIGEGVSSYFRQKTLDNAHRDGQNEQIIKDMAREKTVEARFREAEGAINEAGDTPSDAALRDRLRKNQF